VDVSSGRQNNTHLTGEVDGPSPGGSNFVSGGSSPPLRGGWINPWALAWLG